MPPDESNPASRTPAPDPEIDQRLVRLEEAAAFTDHTVEQLSAEITELNRRLRELAHRTEHLERRLSGVVEEIEKRETNEAGEPQED